MLFWSGVRFLFLTINNVAVFTDVILLPATDLTLLRFALSLAVLTVLIFGFVWDL